MTQRTDTYDPELWQLVPKKATHEMIMALSVSPDFMGQHIIRHSIDKLPDAYEAALRAAPTPPASAQSVEPTGYINSNWPQEKRTGWTTKLYADFSPMVARMPVYTAPPSAEGARDAVIDEALQVAARWYGNGSGIYHSLADLKSKKEAQ